MFKIKVKTLSGNDIGKKQNFTAFFRTGFGAGTNKSYFNYRIISPQGNKISSVHEVKSATSKSDLVLKCIINVLFFIDKEIQKFGIVPDFITIISPELNVDYSKAWLFTKEYLTLNANISSLAYDYEEHDELCRRHKVDKSLAEHLRKYRDKYPSAKFLLIDPERDANKYMKSLHICKDLKDQLDRQLLPF